MSKTTIRIMLTIVSFSLAGIIAIQMYWVKRTIENNDEQFKYHVKYLLDNLYEDIIYGKYEKDNSLYQIKYKDSNGELKTISKEQLEEIINEEISHTNINTKYEYAIYENNKLTTIHSDDFSYDTKDTYHIKIKEKQQGNSCKTIILYLKFPDKDEIIPFNIVGITAISVIFTMIIIITYIGTLNHIIKQKQLAETKADFINNMTHELKTPIATINLAIDAIRNPRIIQDRNKIEKYINMIRDESNRMRGFVERILRISKLEKNELDIKKEAYDISEIIEEAIEHISLILEGKKGKLTVKTPDKKILVLLSDIHFTNVIVNILENSIKYSKQAPEIVLTLEKINNFAIIKISDNGIGISKEAQEFIFDRFFREHSGDLHDVKGHGLGLAYVKRIVEDHNGQIFLESQKGKGSTFTIKLPIIN